MTTLGYLNNTPIPSHWTGWTGDLATAIGELQKFKDWNPGAPLDRAAEALIGLGNDYQNHPGLEGKVLKFDGKKVENTFDHADLCSDADAIRAARELPRQPLAPHLLSDYLRNYWRSTTQLATRFREIPASLGASNAGEAFTAIHNIIFDRLQYPLLWKLNGAKDDDVRDACCRALADYCFRV